MMPTDYQICSFESFFRSKFLHAYVRHHTQMIGSRIIKNDAYAINDEVRFLKGKLLNQGRAPASLWRLSPNMQQPRRGRRRFLSGAAPGTGADERKAHQTLVLGKG